MDSLSTKGISVDTRGEEKAGDRKEEEEEKVAAFSVFPLTKSVYWHSSGVRPTRGILYLAS